MTRTLIVDDNATNLSFLRTLLQGHGYTVDEAPHGAEALAKAREHPPDLIVSDLLMPVMDGYTLLRQWKSDQQLNSIPFVVYTATYTDPRDERLALDLGADAFILKPCEPEDFVSRLHEVLTKVAATLPAVPKPQSGDEDILLRSYNETLIRKLEARTLQLEETNRALQRDIADRELAEAKLRESEERFRELAETIQEVFWIIEPAKNRMLYISPAYEKIWGRTCASLYESPGSWLDSIHPDDRERVRHASQTRQTSGGYDETYRIVRPDGAVRWIHDRAFPVRDAAKNVLRVVGTAEDITNRWHLEEQFRQSQKMDAIGQLATGVAHDFNNILGAILGNAQLALTDTAEEHPARVSLEEIKKTSLRAKSLVQQILAFTRHQPQERRVIEFGPKINEAFTFLRATIPSGIELVFSTDGTTPLILADSTQVYQVITNLCTNAWHALEDRPGRIEVKLESVALDALSANRLSAGLEPGRFARLSVADNGKGMDAATLERIFDPFFTTKELGKGTGLGLSVVHGIVKGHGGAITVKSQPGKGATFQVYFPVATGHVNVATTTVEAPPLRGVGQNILYIDDEESLVFLATRMLERLGYRITGFTHTEDAMKAFRQNPGQFDLVLLDMNMPGASGTQVAADLLKLRPDLPVVLCSGHVTEELRQQARNTGIREVLYKPTTMEEFSEAIHQLAVNTGIDVRPNLGEENYS